MYYSLRFYSASYYSIASLAVTLRLRSELSDCIAAKHYVLSVMFCTEHSRNLLGDRAYTSLRDGPGSFSACKPPLHDRVLNSSEDYKRTHVLLYIGIPIGYIERLFSLLFLHRRRLNIHAPYYFPFLPNIGWKTCLSSSFFSQRSISLVSWTIES